MENESQTSRNAGSMPFKTSKHSYNVRTSLQTIMLGIEMNWNEANQMHLFPMLLTVEPCTGRGEGSFVGRWKSYSMSWRMNQDCSDPRWRPSSLWHGITCPRYKCFIMNISSCHSKPAVDILLSILSIMTPDGSTTPPHSFRSLIPERPCMSSWRWRLPVTRFFGS